MPRLEGDTENQEERAQRLSDLAGRIRAFKDEVDGAHAAKSEADKERLKSAHGLFSSMLDNLAAEVERAVSQGQDFASVVIDELGLDVADLAVKEALFGPVVRGVSLIWPKNDPRILDMLSTLRVTEEMLPRVGLVEVIETPVPELAYFRFSYSLGGSQKPSSVDYTGFVVDLLPGSPKGNNSVESPSKFYE